MSHDSGHDHPTIIKKIESATAPFWTSKYFWFALGFIILCGVAFLYFH